MSQMLDDFRAEGLLDEIAGLEGPHRLTQRLRDPGKVRRRVGISIEDRTRIAFPLDPIHGRRQHPRINEIGIGVASGNSTLEPEAGTVPHHAEAGGPIVVAPDNPSRRKGIFDVALIGIDIRREEQREGPGVFEQPSHGMAKGIGRPGLAALQCLAIPSEERIPIGVGQTHMNVETVARVVGMPFRHKTQRSALLRRYLLRSQLVEHMPISHLQGLGIAKVDFVLPGARLSLAELDGNPRGIHQAPNRTDHRLGKSPGKHMVVLIVGLAQFEVVIVPFSSFGVALFEEKELELTGEMGHQAPG